MRVDKYLWCLRYYKTRSLAATACKKGRVIINQKAVKPSYEVYSTDTISVRKEQINHQLMVLDIPKSRVGAKLVDIYRKNLTPKEAFENKALQTLAATDYRKKGLGRPTKKERRTLDDFLEKEE